MQELREKSQPEIPSWYTSDWSLFGFFCLVAALLYSPILLRVRAFPDGDFTHHFFPFTLYQHQALAAWRLPLWNPYTYGGHPFLADVQAAVYYPLSNLVLLLTLPMTDPAARFYWLQVEVVLHTALAGWFAFLWARDLTGSRWGGVIGGVACALSGYMTGYAPLQLAVLRTGIWIPLLWWLLGRGWQRPQQWRWWVGSAGALSAAFLAGHSQSFLFLLYGTAAWVGVLALTRVETRRHSLIGLIAVGIVTVGFTAAQWLPSVEFVRLSVRANVDYAFVSGGFPLQDVWQIFLPSVLTQYSPLYIGVVGVVLAAIAIFAAITRSIPNEEDSVTLLLPRRAGIFFCLGLAIFALLASLGGNGPLYPLLYWVAPGWAWFRGQERAALLVMLGLAGLAAHGMALLPTLAPRARHRAAMIAGAVVVAVVYAFGLLWQLPGQTAVDHVGYLLIAGLTLVLGLATVMLVWVPGWSLRRAYWVVTLALVNLVVVNGGTNQVAGSPVDRVLVAPEVSALRAAVTERPDAANGLPGRVYNEFRAYEDYGMRAQVEDVWGSSPLRVARYDALFQDFPLDRMWQLLGVEHVLTWRRELFGPSELLGEFPQATDTTYLHRLPSVNPRAWIVPHVEVVDDATALARLGDHEFDLTQRALLGLESEWTELTGELGNVVESAQVKLERRAPGELQVRVTSEQEGLLVVSETWMPGWEVVDPVCSDGGACPRQDENGSAYLLPMRANLTLVGVWLPPQPVEFTLRYRPLSVRLGLWISGATLLILLVVCLWQMEILNRRASRGRQVQASAS